jgi:radical SAM protein with 4Fe4S-binding SPASM domain
MLEICQLDSRGELQMKVTCGPHYERIIRQQGLYQKRKKTSHKGGSVPGRTGHGGPSRGCLAGLGVLFVGHQGDVFPCGYLPINCGNVLEQNLSDIWRNNEDLRQMRNSESLDGKCGICGYREVCGGCRGRAFAATGNYMAEEPFCAYIPPQADH